MADITGIFKSTVKMLKVRHKDISAIKAQTQTGSGDDKLKLKVKVNVNSKLQQANKSLLGRMGGGSDERFSEKTRSIVDNITGLKTFLVKNRKAYMAASSNIPLTRGIIKLTEEERDKIDADAMSYMRLCNETLAKYKSEVLHIHLSSQHREHRTLVIHMVEEYLKAVCQLYSEQRAIRVKRAVDRQKMSRLEIQPVPNTMSRKAQGASRLLNLNNSERSDATTNHHALVFDDFESDIGATTEVTSEEAQLFKLENDQFYSDMNSNLDEVRQIEGKVVEISRLQEIFTEKVLEQDTDISRIGDAMVHSTENIVQGNDDIREAMKNNAGMRVWIIFGIIVLSFTLLFLDWYND